MNLLKIISLFITIFLLIFSCNKHNNCTSIPLKGNGICIDYSLIDDSSFCIEVYDPVCGCNGVTYSNSCHAINFGGVTSFVSGVCCD